MQAARLAGGRPILNAEQARSADEVDLDDARQALNDAQAMSPTDAGYAERQAAIERARAQVKPESPY